MLLAQTRKHPVHYQHNQQQPEEQTQQQPQALTQDACFYEHQGSPYFAGSDIDLDTDLATDILSVSSSPASTQSLLSQYPGVEAQILAAFDSTASAGDPARAQRDAALSRLLGPAYGAALGDVDEPAFFAASDLMHADSWFSAAHMTPKSAGRTSHNRDSSLSSLGSTGPASPYSHNVSNPQIAVTDSVDDLHGFSVTEDAHSQFMKSTLPSATHETFYTTFPHYTSAGTTSIQPNMPVVHRQGGARGLLPPSDFQRGQNTSRPVSVASSIVSDSPATPSGEIDDDRRQRTTFNAVPKLDRTMTDVYNDELYNPSFNMASGSHSQVPVSPSNDLFAQRLRAANTQHLSATHSPALASSRDRSPFRHGSPLAPMPNHDFSSAMSSTQLGFGSAQQLREQRKAEQDAQAMQQQLARRSDTGTPQTISPKDAVLDFHSPQGEPNFPLFPQQDSGGFDAAQLKGFAPGSQSFNDLQLNGATFGNYVGDQLPANVQVPQQYPFIAQQPHQQSRDTPVSTSSAAPSRLSSAESGQSEPGPGHDLHRPTGSSADGGTYTCTYHGCTLRFDTPALLQKHKREGHRQAHALGGSQQRTDRGGATVPSSLFNSQAGPHRCHRINPSTGKQCNTVFSRPYDLTRHEHTIHNARKKKARCELCTDDKTFSRGDALTRHYRVCHPDVEFPGKRRKRGGQSV